MQFRTGTMDDVAMLWALRTRCVRETCSSHYPPEVIAPWSASPPPSQYARLLSQGGCVVAEDGQGGLLGFGVWRLKSVNPLPDETAKALEENVKWLMNPNPK